MRMNYNTAQQSPAYDAVIRTASAFAAITGLLSLTGWLFNIPWLTTYGDRFIPMAPSTALLFLILGALAYGSGKSFPASRKTVTAICALLSLVLLYSSANNYFHAVEHLGFDIRGNYKGVVIGHMSPVTAGCFILVCLVLLSMGRARKMPTWRTIFTFATTGALLAVCSILILGYTFGMPIPYGNSAIPPSLPTTIGFSLLGISLVSHILKYVHLTELDETENRSIPLLLIFIFTVFSAGLLTSGYMFYKNYEHQQRVAIEKHLAAISVLKSNELQDWRAERLSDARFFYGNESFASHVRAFRKSRNNADSKEKIQSWLDKFRYNHEYDLFLIDTTGSVLFSSVNNGVPLSRESIETAKNIVSADGLTIRDFHRNEYSKKVFLSVFIPVFDSKSNGCREGIVIVRIDPNTYLYPYLNKWPIPSETAETLLIRADSQKVVFLNDVRFQQNSALKLSVPLSDTLLPAVKAVYGMSGIVDGIDYRGVRVVANIAAVPESPWYIVTKVDEAEVYAPIKERFWFIIGSMIAMLVGAAAIVVSLWRQQKLRFYRRRYLDTEALRISEQRLRHAEQIGKTGHWIYSATDRSVQLSDEMRNIFGFAPESNGITLDDLSSRIHPDDVGSFADLHGIQQQSDEGTGEFRLLRGDGEMRYILAKYAVLRDPGGAPGSIHVAAVDSTEIKKKERELQARNNELARFAYTVSHDLKSPLVTVKTFIGYLQEDVKKQDEARQATDIMYISTAIDKMGRLLDELLEMSRIGRIMNASVRITFMELVKEALGSIAGGIVSTGTQVVVGDDDIDLYGDRIRLAEILENLIENAIKYRNPDNPRIEIGFDRKGVDTVFFVCDNGVGIDPRYQEKVFGLFEQLDPSSPGTGLGLALVKRIVELYNGTIWVESEGAGKGACFRFTLPEALIYTNKE